MRWFPSWDWRECRDSHLLFVSAVCYFAVKTAEVKKCKKVLWQSPVAVVQNGKRDIATGRQTKQSASEREEEKPVTKVWLRGKDKYGKLCKQARSPERPFII